MATILDGKKLSEELSLLLINKVSQMIIKPKLVIVQIGDLERSNAYIKRKQLFAEKIGVLVIYEKYGEDIEEEEVIRDILKFNADSHVHGIIVQLPIPKKFNATKIIESIDQAKDVDGLTAKNTKLLFDNLESFIPATSKGIMTLLEHYKIGISGKKVVVIGESVLVGRPIAITFLNRKATVTICHTKTENLQDETRRADILVVACGSPHLITKDYVTDGQVIIDVGISLDKDGKIVGDVDFENVKDIVSAISPVPGGVGPMTVFSLFDNLLKSYAQLV